MIVLCQPAAASLGAEADPPVKIFAAASLTNVLTAIADAYRNETGGNLALVFAGSSTLARQIELGAPADIYISANTAWVDYLDERGLLAPHSRRTITANRLVVIAHQDDGSGHSDDLSEILGSGRIAMADPAAVPAGIYAREALEQAGLWRDVSGRTLSAANVRAALAWVARGEADTGIVYQTDVVYAPNVSIVYRFPTEALTPIRYDAAALGDRATDDVIRVLVYLCSPPAQAIFAEHGFAPALPSGTHGCLSEGALP